MAGATRGLVSKMLIAAAMLVIVLKSGLVWSGEVSGTVPRGTAPQTAGLAENPATPQA